MGNCWGTPVKSSHSPTTTRPSDPGNEKRKRKEGKKSNLLMNADGYFFLCFPPALYVVFLLASSKNNSNEGMHPGPGSVISSGMDDVFINGQILPTPNLRIFTFEELKTATRNFRSDTVLGEGGFGTVFKGWVDEKTFAPAKAGSGMVIAVKKLNSESLQGRKEWESEVNYLGRLSHPNIVKLLGYCCQDEELLLVYEFMSRGSLERHLFRRGPAFQPLSWSMRLNIAIGAARALEFLHSDGTIYRDFKASNILLDSNYNVKICDFGLARDGPQNGASHVSTGPKGTYGYAAPEYVATGRLCRMSDVYSFGVVWLEMLSGLRVLDLNRPTEHYNLVKWAKPYLSNRRKLLSLVMDEQIEGQYPSKGAVLAAKLTVKCLETKARGRPSMSEVVRTLEKIQAIKHKP